MLCKNKQIVSENYKNWVIIIVSIVVHLIFFVLDPYLSKNGFHRSS